MQEQQELVAAEEELGSAAGPPCSRGSSRTLGRGARQTAAGPRPADYLVSQGRGGGGYSAAAGAGGIERAFGRESLEQQEEGGLGFGRLPWAGPSRATRVDGPSLCGGGGGGGVEEGFGAKFVREVLGLLVVCALMDFSFGGGLLTAG